MLRARRHVAVDPLEVLLEGLRRESVLGHLHREPDALGHGDVFVRVETRDRDGEAPHGARVVLLGNDRGSALHPWRESELLPQHSVSIDVRDRLFDREAPANRRGRNAHRHGSEVPRHEEPGGRHQRIGDGDKQQAEGIDVGTAAPGGEFEGERAGP